MVMFTSDLLIFFLPSKLSYMAVENIQSFSFLGSFVFFSVSVETNKWIEID